MQPYVVTISSEKGGVGKTTLATNLAIYLKALQEDLSVTLFSFDNHFSVDQMFRIRPRPDGGDVHDLLCGRPVAELLELGEFGVQFIPSSYRLGELRDSLADPAVLGRALAAGGLDGIVVIDTRPDLDHFTCNALYAADRVIVPVKDAPSLENSKHLYDFFDRHGLSRQALRVLPCLIDSRIHFSGPFENPQQLLRAYALNRGYRCMDGFIAKSPKVESLNTNPEGRIYPVLTHGRGTEVHQQLTGLAHQLLTDAAATESRQLERLAEAEQSSRSRRRRAFLQRAERMPSACLLCAGDFRGDETDAFFLENAAGTRAGFSHGDCLTGLILNQVYASRQDQHDAALRELFLESAKRSYFGLSCPDPIETEHLLFYRFDERGEELSSRLFNPGKFRSGWFARTQPSLQLLWQDLAEPAPAGERLVLIRRVGEGGPSAILEEEAFAAFALVKAVVLQRLPSISAAQPVPLPISL